MRLALAGVVTFALVREGRAAGVAFGAGAGAFGLAWGATALLARLLPTEGLPAPHPRLNAVGALGLLLLSAISVAAFLAGRALG